MTDKVDVEAADLTPKDELVSLASWQVPAASVQRTLRDAFSTFVGHFREPFQGGADTFEVEPDIASLSRYQLRRFAPDPDRQSQAESLGLALGRYWGQGASGAPDSVTCLVTPPYTGVAENLAWLAEQREWRLITPPDDLLLSELDAEAWWDQQQLSEGPWVIPELARFWLRHRSGLALLRVLFGRLAAQPQMPGVIGCTSWCWSFWGRYLPGLALAPQTLPPMTSDRLAGWLSALPGHRQASPLTVRQTNNGHWVLIGNGDADSEGLKRSNLLRDLAAVARGNAGVALALWRKSLRARPDESLEENDDNGEMTTVAPGERRCWVIPLEHLTLPSVPSGASREMTGILHTLLLHDGLDERELAIALPLPDARLRLLLHNLARNELIECLDTRWGVTALAYPSVRRSLHGAGYPVDGF